MFSRAGKVLAEYIIPGAKNVASVTFGGPKLDILFVTTKKDGDPLPNSGHLFQITGLGTVGTPGVKVKLFSNCSKCQKPHCFT